MKKIAIAGFQHETNTFAPSMARYEHFVNGGGFPAMTRGDAILNFRDINIPAGGFIHTAEGLVHELLPIIWTAATPSAHVERATFERICDEIIAGLQAAQADAVYLDLHGAMVAEHFDDGEGEILRRVRAAVGPNVPVVASLDLHANVTQAMFEHADVLCAFRTYPHVDMARTGSRCAQILDEILRGAHYIKALKRLPFLISINGQCTFLDPAQSAYALLDTLEQETGAHLSFTPGFPAADFAECGGVVWGYARDEAALQDAIVPLLDFVLDHEADWAVDFLSPDEAVAKAMALAAEHQQTVVIADTQDNPGAGGDSNTTGMLKALHAAQAQNAAIGLITDPQVVQLALQAGVGNRFTAALGGQSGVAGDTALTAEFVVEAVCDGKCRYDGPMMHGVEADVGNTVRLGLGGIQIVVSSGKAQMLDRNLFKMAGVIPEEKAVVVVKSSVHFRADFQPIAAAVLVAKAPGPMTADPADLPWQKLNPHIKTSPLGKTLAQQA